MGVLFCFVVGCGQHIIMVCVCVSVCVFYLSKWMIIAYLCIRRDILLRLPLICRVSPFQSPLSLFHFFLFFVLFLPRSFLCRLLVWPINFLLFPFPFHLLLDFFSAPLLFHKPVTPTFPCCWTYSPQLRRHRTVPHFGGFRQLHSFFGVGVPHFGGIGQSHISGRSVQTVPHFFGVG